jgi:hypothetical protein
MENDINDKLDQLEKSLNKPLNDSVITTEEPSMNQALEDDPKWRLQTLISKPLQELPQI